MSKETREGREERQKEKIKTFFSKAAKQLSESEDGEEEL